MTWYYFRNNSSIEFPVLLTRYLTWNLAPSLPNCNYLAIWYSSLNSIQILILLRVKITHLTSVLDEF